jgi:IS30 family transposase
MTKKYRQLNLVQRYKIEAYLALGKTQTAIANLLGVHKSTICRELQRNVAQRGLGAKKYMADRAQSKTEKRHITKPKHTRFTNILKEQMSILLSERKFSPELVAAQWRKDNTESVSHETMYQFIWNCKHTNRRENKRYKNLYKHLKHG